MDIIANYSSRKLLGRSEFTRYYWLLLDSLMDDNRSE
jgi:hypothetical protein